MRRRSERSIWKWKRWPSASRNWKRRHESADDSHLKFDDIPRLTSA
jgi:hypothetical protein